MKSKEPICRGCYKPFDPEANENDGYGTHFCSHACAQRNWVQYARVPHAFWEIDFAHPQMLRIQEQIRQVKAWIHERDCYRGQPCLLHHGELSGTGKTRLGTYAQAWLVGQDWCGLEEEEAAAKDGCGPAGLWFNVNRFRERYGRVMRDAEAKADWQWELTEAHELFLDDVDKLKPSEGLLELVFGVIDDRLTSGRTTVLTTNLNGDRLAEKWGPEYGEYLVRRLRDFSVAIDFDVAMPIANVVNLQTA